MGELEETHLHNFSLLLELARYVTRAFYEPIHVLIVEVLTTTTIDGVLNEYSRDHICDYLGVDKSMVLDAVNDLRGLLMVQKEARDVPIEEYANRTEKIEVYTLDLTFVNVVHYKIGAIRDKLAHESSMQHTAVVYACGDCKRIYSEAQAASLPHDLDAFVCECGGKVHEKDEGHKDDTGEGSPGAAGQGKATLGVSQEIMPALPAMDAGSTRSRSPSRSPSRPSSTSSIKAGGSSSDGEDEDSRSTATALSAAEFNRQIQVIDSLLKEVYGITRIPVYKNKIIRRREGLDVMSREQPTSADARGLAGDKNEANAAASAGTGAIGDDGLTGSGNQRATDSTSSTSSTSSTKMDVSAFEDAKQEDKAARLRLHQLPNMGWASGKPASSSGMPSRHQPPRRGGAGSGAAGLGNLGAETGGSKHPDCRSYMVSLMMRSLWGSVFGDANAGAATDAEAGADGVTSGDDGGDVGLRRAEEKPGRMGRWDEPVRVSAHVTKRLREITPEDEDVMDDEVYSEYYARALIARAHPF